MKPVQFQDMIDAQANAARIAKNRTYLLRSGERVTSRDGEWPTQYSNRTQAEAAAATLRKYGINATVIVRGRPFYVKIEDS